MGRGRSERVTGTTFRNERLISFGVSRSFLGSRLLRSRISHSAKSIISVVTPMSESEDFVGEELSIRYVPLSDARKWDWKDNPKKHDTDQLINAITRYGFKDPPKYEPELDAFGHGNGRTHALVKMKEHGLDAPRGVLMDDEGEWHIPVLFGVSSASKSVAEAYAVDHNNLTMAGGDFTPEDLASMWEGDGYAKILKGLGDELPQTVTPEEMERVMFDAGEKDATEEIEIPEPSEQKEPELESECKIVIYCSNADRDDFANTLLEWDEREGVTVNISS